MSNIIQLVYIGNCKEILESFKESNKILITRENIKFKDESMKFKSPSLWAYYSVSFECKDKVDPPKGEIIAGDFMGCQGYMKKC